MLKCNDLNLYLSTAFVYCILTVLGTNWVKILFMPFRKFISNVKVILVHDRSISVEKLMVLVLRKIL